MNNQSQPLLKINDLNKHFHIKRGRVVRAVDGVSLSIKRGHTLGLVGESGCGKSTLGRTIIGIYPPTSGTVEFNGQQLKPAKTKADRLDYATKMQMIFQDPYASLNPRMTVRDIIAEGIDARKERSKAERNDRVLQLLNIVGLNEEHANRYPHEFSGGQRQRVGIARALSMEPEFIICDEPISALDVSIQAQIMNMLVQLQQAMELTYLFIAHDISMVRYISDDIAVMYLGSVMEHAESDELYNKPLHPYTKALFSAIPVPNPQIERQRKQLLLKGDIPSPIDVPAGCKFSTRCPEATDICKQQAPVLRECAPGHSIACHHI